MADKEYLKLYARVSAQQFLLKRLLAQLASENAEEDDPWELLEVLKAEIVEAWEDSRPSDSETSDEMHRETLSAVQEIILGAQALVGEPEEDYFDDVEDDDEDEDEILDDDGDYLEEDEYREDEDREAGEADSRKPGGEGSR